MHCRSTCSIGCPKPRSMPSESAATSSASRTVVICRDSVCTRRTLRPHRSGGKAEFAQASVGRPRRLWLEVVGQRARNCGPYGPLTQAAQGHSVSLSHRERGGEMAKTRLAALAAVAAAAFIPSATNAFAHTATLAAATSTTAADLTPSSVQASATTVGAGHALTTTYTVTNSGGSATQPWTDSVFLSKDTSLDGTDVALGSTSITSDLAALGSYVTSVAGTVPVGTPGGTYYVLVETDSGNVVTEGDETNNVAASSSITVDSPDLGLLNEGTGGVQGFPNPVATGTFQFSANTVGAGHNFNVTYTLQNHDLGDTTQPFNNQLYLSHDPVLDSGDLLLDTQTFTSPLAGASTINNPTNINIFRQNLQVPTGTPGGNYYVIVKLDSGNNLAETNLIPTALNGENDNTVVLNGLLQIDSPDLGLLNEGTGGVQGFPNAVATGTFQFSADTVGAGHSFNVTYTLQNHDLGDTTQPFNNQLYLSHDPVLDSGDLLLDTQTFTSPLAGASTINNPTNINIFRSNLQVPVGTPGGNYYVIVKLDSGNNLAETNLIPTALNGENDNTGVLTVLLTVAAPDRQVFSGPVFTLPNGATAANPGDTIKVTYAIKNAGGGDAVGSWNDKLYLSADSTLDGGDPLVGTVAHIGGLTTGSTYTVTDTPIVVPNGTTPGTYRIFVRTDDGNPVGEVDETNKTPPSCT